MNRTVEVDIGRKARLTVISGLCERCGTAVELTPFDRDGVMTVVCCDCKETYDKIESIAFVLAQMSDVDLELLFSRVRVQRLELVEEEDLFNQE